MRAASGRMKGRGGQGGAKVSVSGLFFVGCGFGRFALQRSPRGMWGAVELGGHFTIIINEKKNAHWAVASRRVARGEVGLYKSIFK